MLLRCGCGRRSIQRIARQRRGSARRTRRQSGQRLARRHGVGKRRRKTNKSREVLFSQSRDRKRTSQMAAVLTLRACVLWVGAGAPELEVVRGRIGAHNADFISLSGNAEARRWLHMFEDRIPMTCIVTARSRAEDGGDMVRPRHGAFLDLRFKNASLPLSLISPYKLSFSLSLVARLSYRRLIRARRSRQPRI